MCARERSEREYDHQAFPSSGKPRCGLFTQDGQARASNAKLSPWYDIAGFWLVDAWLWRAKECREEGYK